MSPVVPKDVLADFPLFTKFDRNGLEVTLTFAAPGHPAWNEDLEQTLFDIEKANMRELYNAAPGWSWGDVRKRAEMTDAEQRYLVARNRADGAVVGFAAFRFVLEGDFDVLYLYELQLTPAAQHKGLGRFLMQVCELIARKQGMQWVLLTVLKNNAAAAEFYAKMKYEIDSSSPSASGEESGHEILSKVVDKAGVAAIEKRAEELAGGVLPDDADAVLGKAAGTPASVDAAAASGAGARTATR